jgi:hypothetical protein
VKRVVVTVAVPIFFSKPPPIPMDLSKRAKDVIANALKDHIQSGDFLSFTQNK